MSNTYFQFKQFRIEQDRCAMKVTTDACIQGAWTPILQHVKRVLDIGAGTGILSLMLAQRNKGILIDAIEFDRDAAGQARENVTGSLWNDRIQVWEGDVRNYMFPCKYDLIISNPPFFNNSLLGYKTNKNIARHTQSLSYIDLLKVVGSSLKDDGYVSILLPYDEYVFWKTLAAGEGWNEFSRLSIRHSPYMPVKRVVGLFSKSNTLPFNEHTIMIKKNEQNYTKEFIELLAPFYLELG